MSPKALAPAVPMAFLEASICLPRETTESKKRKRANSQKKVTKSRTNMKILKARWPTLVILVVKGIDAVLTQLFEGDGGRLVLASDDDGVESGVGLQGLCERLSSS